MPTHFETTWQMLARTRNRAVLPVLAAGLRSALAEIRAAAIRATFQRVDTESHCQWIRLFKTFSDTDRAILVDSHRAIPHHAAPALKTALLGTDRTLCDNACQFILECHDFDSVPTLLQATAIRHHPRENRIAETILQLASLLRDRSAEWAGSGEQAKRDPTFVRRQVLAALERSLNHAALIVRSEVVEAFLLLAPSDHPTLLRILGDSHHVCHGQLSATISSREHPAVFEMLVAMLRDVEAPIAVLEAIARRTDRPFLEYLLRALRHPVPLRVLHNMQRLHRVAWLESPEILLNLDGRAQAIAVELAVASEMEKATLFDLLTQLVREGLAEGRRAACHALAEFDGPTADLLVLAALNDPDTDVQAAAVRQLRPRRLPEALKKLDALLDAPSAEIRAAARSSLAEFNFVRYRAMFDLLDESTLQTTGMLVRKVDDSAIEGLLDELAAPSISARLRGIEMAVAMRATQEVCEQLVELAKHEIVGVRVEALAALADCTGPKVLEVLELAASDANHSVADTASQGLLRHRQRVSATSIEHAPSVRETS